MEPVLPMPGRTFSHYRVLEKIGAGGMGEVYRAHDQQLDRDVAIKILAPSAAGESGARERLLREARAVAALNHPHVCTVHEVGETEGQIYIAMEWVDGQPLDRRIPAGGLPLEQVLRYGVQIAEGVAHAHDRGIVHRDLKPGNIVITAHDRAKVLDFGLAKRVSGKPLGEATTHLLASLTQAGSLVGTVPYMAPEQLRGEEADARSDVWALGVVLHEMIAGQRPFRGQTGFELSSEILNQPPASLPARVPLELRAVLARCLEKDPRRRYQRAGELQAALEAIRQGATVSWAAWRHGLVRLRWPAWSAAVAALLLVLLALDVGGLRHRLAGRVGAPRAIRMAVLPFANLSGDPEQEYLSDGMTQEMIAQLGRLHPESLSVIARTSVMRYKKSDTPIDQIGRELGVDYVLEGSAQREAGRIRISAELIQVRDQTQLWAESYERELAGILALQSDVAHKVAEALALKLLPAEQARLTYARSVDPEAYEAYLKGLQHTYTLTPADLDTALSYFELALQKDPRFALAYAGISFVWGGRNQIGAALPGEAAPKAEAAAMKAVELDDRLAEAHYMLAVVRTWQVWDLPAAEAEWQRAIALNPNFPDARAFYSHYLHIMRRPEEAMVQIRRALELDPFNVLFQAIYAGDLVFARQYEDAIAQARAALRMEPGHPVAVATLWIAFRLQGKHDEALAAARQYLSWYGDADLDRALDRGLAEAGYSGAMRRAADALAARFRSTYGPPTDVADFYLEAGDEAKALEWLEKAYEVRDPNLPYITQPSYDPLRSDPRFQDLLRRMKLPS